MYSRQGSCARLNLRTKLCPDQTISALARDRYPERAQASLAGPDLAGPDWAEPDSEPDLFAPDLTARGWNLSLDSVELPERSLQVTRFAVLALRVPAAGSALLLPVEAPC